MEKGSVIRHQHRSGRPTIFQEDVKEKIIQNLKENPKIIQKDLASNVLEEKGTNVSQSMISR